MARRAERKCSSCNKQYYRCNKTSAWTMRNPGHRRGWFKEEASVCMSCLPVSDARKMFAFVGVRISIPKVKATVK